jgi:hypothetical protein
MRVGLPCACSNHDRTRGHLGAGSRGFLIAFGSIKQALLTTFFRLPGAPIEIPASRKASFRPSKELKERLNGKAEEMKEAAAS